MITDPFVGILNEKKCGAWVLAYHERVGENETVKYLRSIGRGSIPDLMFVRHKDDALVFNTEHAEAYLTLLTTLYEDIHEEDFECYWEVEQ